MSKTFYMRGLFRQIEALNSPDLVTREFGTIAYNIVKHALEEVGLDEVLLLSFDSIRAVDSSFAGASVIKLLRELVDGKLERKYLVATHLTSNVQESIDTTILGYGLKIALLILRDSGDLGYLGHLEPSLGETFQMINTHGKLAARELADMKSLEINNASTRLKKLYDLRLIDRTEEISETGRQHLYHPVKV